MELVGGHSTAARKLNKRKSDRRRMILANEIGFFSVASSAGKSFAAKDGCPIYCIR